MSSYYRHHHQSSSNFTPGEAHIETAAALHGYRGDKEEASGGGPSATGGTLYSLPLLTNYDEDGSLVSDACVAAASLSPSQVRVMASAIAKDRNEATSIVRSKRRMKENTENSTCSIDSQLERNNLLNRSFGHRDLLLEANVRDCYENIAAKCRVEDGDCQRPLVRNFYKDGSYIDGGCFEGYNVSYGKNSRGEQNAGFCQIVNQLAIGLDKSKIKKNKTDEKCIVPTNYEEGNLRGNNLREYSPGALRGMANPTDPNKLLCISKQDMMNPNGVVLHSGMKLEEFIKILVNSLRVGNESQVTFVGREIYLLKSLKPPIGQSEVEMHNLALNKIKNAILYYVTNYVDEKYAVRVFYALYSISQFFVNVTRYPSDGGTEDAESIIKALLLIRKCPTKNIAMDVEQAFETNSGKGKGRVSESELLSALEKCDVKLIRFLVAKLCCCLHDGGDFAAIDVVSESFPEPHCSMKNTDVYDSGVVRENFDFANSFWKQLLNLALETDKKIKDNADNPFDGLGVNVIGVAMDALRVFYNGTFYTSNTTSKLSILSSACVFLAYARSQLTVASPPVVSLEADIRDTVDAVSDDTFDYERDHCYIPTSERYETTGLVAFDEVYAPRSSAVTYVPHQEFPSLVEKVSGTFPRQMEYYKYLTRFDDDDDTLKKPCTPATALYATALKLASANYTERINNLAAATINPTIENQQFGCTMDNLSEEDTGRLNINISEERYLLSTDEDMIKRFRTTTVNDKYGLDKSFMYAVKRLLGVSTPVGRYGLNLIDAKVLWPVQNSDIKQDEMNGPSKRHRIAFESGVIGPHSTLDSEDPMVVADTTAEANWDDFKEYLCAKAENKMRFLSLIILRAIMGVGKKLERSDIHLCLGEDKRIFYITIDNEERVGMKKCEDVLEDSAEFIALCTPVTNEDMQLLPPWCAVLFDGDCDSMEVEKKPRKRNKGAAAEPAASNSDDDEFVETTDRFKKAFKYSDLNRYLHEMSLGQLGESNADSSLVKKIINHNMKAARNAEHDKILADANSRLRAAYGAAIQDKYLYDESSRRNIHSQEYDSDEDMHNPFIPEGENAFFHVGISQDTEYAQSDDDNFLPTLTPAEKLRQEYFRYCTYNLNCKIGGKVSLPSSDDECQRGDNILISRRMILNDIKTSISEAARTSFFVFFDRCMRRIYRNLNRIIRAAWFLHEKN